ncbi:MAG: hypothetical protein PWQ55_2437, partial [Chloroflexota bacterium]|nr:hypothetical protein [Chloroflexota bacterium]
LSTNPASTKLPEDIFIPFFLLLWFRFFVLIL